MNELIFFSHILMVFFFTLLALKRGKDFLILCTCLQFVLANLFVSKEIILFGFQVTCSDAFAVGGLLGLNLLQEYFGKEVAKKTGFIAFYSLIFFGVMSQIHLLYIPSLHDTSHTAFHRILSTAPRLLFASIASFFIVQRLDIQIFYLLKKGPFAFRSTLSLLISQFCDTVLFTILGLWGVMASLMDIIILSFLIKASIILFLVPFTLLSKRWIKV